MSVTSVNSSNPYSSIQWPQPDDIDGSAASNGSAPSDPLQSLFQALSGGGSSDPLLGGGTDDGSVASSPGFQLSPDVMQALLSVQSGQGASQTSPSQSLFDKFDANGDGQISQSEFETAIGSGADKSKVDELFSKIDTNGDGSISDDEMTSAAQKVHGGGGHHHHAHAAGGKGGSDPFQDLLSGASADGTTSQSTSNSDGSTTTTLTYSDGTKVEMTVPGASSDSGSTSTSSNPEAPNLANMLKQLISLQAQLAAPTTSLSV
jgi:hypothetical protein